MIVWGDRGPGDIAIAGDGVIIIGDTVTGDYVKFPDGHPLAGSTAQISAVEFRSCPQCEIGSKNFILGERRYGVVECAGSCGFVWYVAKDI